MDVERALIEFHSAFGHPIGDTPMFPKSADLRNLRWSLIMEEFMELADADRKNDLVGLADAIADLVYVLVGMAVAYGIPFNEVFAEVHRSNMSKLGKDGKPVYRKDGKVLKGPSYYRPDVAGILSYWGKRGKGG